MMQANLSRRFLAALVALAVTGGCKEVDHQDPDIAAAIAEVNGEFRSGYAEVLAQAGTRHFDLAPADAHRHMRRVLEQLGFTVTGSEGDYYLSVVAPAPTPLDPAEWDAVCRAHEPRMREIAVKHIGVKGHFVQLEPDGLNIVGTVTFLPAAQGTDISITLRMLEIRPQPADSILPRREYPPPAAVRIGYEKIWKALAAQSVGAGLAATTR